MKVAAALSSFFKISLPVIILLFVSSCSKEYSQENVNTSMAAGTWQFKEGASDYMGDIDTAYIQSGTSTNEMHLIGTSKDGSQTFHLTLYADEFNPGTYKTTAFQSSFEYFSGRLDIYQAAQPFGEFTVTITAVNKNTITGIFSGKASADGQTIIDIFSGSFSAIFAAPVIKPKSEGALTNDEGNCMPVAVNGNYKQGIPLNSTNTVGIQAAITKAGTFTIYTDKKNGVVFSAKGEFSQNGLQSVTLTGTGIPEESGDFSFTLHYGNSMCAFTVHFEAGAAPSRDYFPTSDNSNWTYTDGVTDYTMRVIPAKVTINGNTYSVILQGTDTAYVARKVSGDYFDFINYKKSLSLSGPLNLETVFLKDNVAVGSTWDGPSFTDVSLGGMMLNLRFEILAKGVTASSGTFTFPDVIKVKTDIYSGGTLLMPLSESWYAKNVGLVFYEDKTDNSTLTIKAFNIL